MNLNDYKKRIEDYLERHYRDLDPLITKEYREFWRGHVDGIELIIRDLEHVMKPDFKQQR